MSSAKMVCPIHFDAASTFLRGFPTTFNSSLLMVELRCPLLIQSLRQFSNTRYTGRGCLLTPLRSPDATDADSGQAVPLPQAKFPGCSSRIALRPGPQMLFEGDRGGLHRPCPRSW